MKLLTCRCHHLIDMLVGFCQNLTLKMAERAIPVNVYQFLHELLRMRALWQKMCQQFFRQLKSSKNPQLGESCQDWPSSSIRPVLYIPCYCILWHPLSVISFISGISDDTVSFDEIAVLFNIYHQKYVFYVPDIIIRP